MKNDTPTVAAMQSVLRIMSQVIEQLTSERVNWAKPSIANIRQRVDSLLVHHEDISLKLLELGEARAAVVTIAAATGGVPDEMRIRIHRAMRELEWVADAMHRQREQEVASARKIAGGE